MVIKEPQDVCEKLQSDIFPILPRTIVQILTYEINLDKLEEIRLRVLRPLMVVVENQDYFLGIKKFSKDIFDDTYIVTKEDINKTLQFISKSSIYAMEEELKNGFITLKGGHRVGITGKAILEKGSLKTLKNISGINIRVAREIKGVAKELMDFVIDDKERPYNTLIISPPKAGKTTLLRDMVRLLSNGIKGVNQGFNIGLVDERSEIACCYNGIPQNDIGIRTDVLDGCPKAQGMSMLLRTMSPEIIATDEVGKYEDIDAIAEAIKSGVSVITTAHGADLNDIKKRPIMKEMIENRFFDRYLILGFSQGVGTLEEVIDNDFKTIYSREGG